MMRQRKTKDAKRLYTTRETKKNFLKHKYKGTNIYHEDTVKRCSYDDKALRNDRKSSSFKSLRNCCELFNVDEVN